MSSFAKLATSVALAAMLAAPAFAHMDLADPTPFRSKSNPQYNGSPLIDYSMTAPLNKDGSNFPCKGYHVDNGGVSNAVKKMVAGQDFSVSIQGGAAHNGGSCQFSVSYDNAETWAVLHSVVGGCPTTPNYTFKVPEGLPAGKNVLFAWTWFNFSGNREMYMNCASIDVESSGTGVTLPAMFKANIFGEEKCTTIEGQNVDFANPAGQTSNCGDLLVTPDKTVTLGSGGSTPAPEPEPQPEPQPEPEPTPEPEPPVEEPETPTEPPAEEPPVETPEDPCPPEEEEPTPDPEPTPTPQPEPPVEEDPCPPEEEDPTPEPEPTPTPQPEPPVEEDPCPPEEDPEVPEPTTNVPVPTTTTKPDGPSTHPVPPPSTSQPPTTQPTTPAGDCTPGAYKCAADGLSWFMCAHNRWVAMGAVAPGTKCVDGKHVTLTRRGRERMIRRLTSNY